MQILSTGKTREEAVEQAEQNIEELKKQMEEAEKIYQDFLFGDNLSYNIAKAIMEGMEQGKSGAESFADFVQKMLQQAVINSLITNSLMPKIEEEFVPMLNAAIDDRTISENEKDNLLKWANDFYASVVPLFEAAGALFPSGSPNKALAGSIKGVSEQTASLVAGQMNAMRITQADTNAMIRQQLMHLSNIDAYSRYLQSIDSSLSNIDSKDKRGFFEASGAVITR